MPDKLSLYNGALSELGERRLKDLTENREPRFVLDDVWDRGALERCLQKGQWNFATRSARLDYDPSLAPDFGYQRGFKKPDDWVRTVGFCHDEYFRETIFDYADEGGYWWCDFDNVYVRYVSSDDQYGLDLSLYPDNYTKYVECYLAQQALKRLTQGSTSKQEIDMAVKQALKEAKNTDAMDDAQPVLPGGSWSGSRRSRSSGRDDRGNRNSLYG